jgi:hypothetical protein
MGLVAFISTSFFINLSSGINISLAQEQCPENKAMAAGIINGFSWGVVGLCLSPIGFMIESIGIIKSLMIISTIPAVFGVLYYRR